MAREVKVSILIEAREQARKALKSVQNQFNVLERQVSEFNRRYKQNLEELNGSVKVMESGLKRLIAGYLSWAGIREILDTTEEISRMRQMRKAFEDLAKSVGQSADDILRAMRDATKGTVHDITLIQMANRALMAGLPVTAEQMGLLARVARQLGKVMGIETTEAFARLVQGIAKGEPELLDELGLVVSRIDAYKKYAQALGKSASELTKQEQVLAFYNAVLETSERRIKELGPDHITLADRMSQARVAVKDFSMALATAITGGKDFSDVIRYIVDGVRFFTENIREHAEAIRVLVSWVTKLIGAWALMRGFRFMTVHILSFARALRILAISAKNAQLWLSRLNIIAFIGTLIGEWVLAMRMGREKIETELDKLKEKFKEFGEGSAIELKRGKDEIEKELALIKVEISRSLDEIDRIIELHELQRELSGIQISLGVEIDESKLRDIQGRVTFLEERLRNIASEIGVPMKLGIEGSIMSLKDLLHGTTAEVDALSSSLSEFQKSGQRIEFLREKIAELNELLKAIRKTLSKDRDEFEQVTSSVNKATRAVQRFISHLEEAKARFAIERFRAYMETQKQILESQYKAGLISASEYYHKLEEMELERIEKERKYLMIRLRIAKREYQAKKEYLINLRDIEEAERERRLQQLEDEYQIKRLEIESALYELEQESRRIGVRTEESIREALSKTKTGSKDVIEEMKGDLEGFMGRWIEAFILIEKKTKLTLKNILEDFKRFIARVIAMLVAEELVGGMIKALKLLLFGGGFVAQHGAVIRRPSLLIAGEREEEVVVPTKALYEFAEGRMPNIRRDVLSRLQSAFHSREAGIRVDVQPRIEVVVHEATPKTYVEVLYGIPDEGWNRIVRRRIIPAMKRTRE